MYLEDLSRVRIGTISPTLNGGNFVATANSSDHDDPFFNVADALSITSIRFPGGDITERHLSPSSSTWDVWVTSTSSSIILPDGRQIATLRSFLETASSTDTTISFVIPTEGLLLREADGSFDINTEALTKVATLVEQMILGEYGSLNIRQFEIGNEYYLDGRLTAEEYGFVANRVAIALNSTFDAHRTNFNSEFFQEPDIVVQAGPPWQLDDNRNIIDQLSSEARAAIDGVVIHWYPRNLDRIGNLDRWFGSIDEWDRAEGFPTLNLHVTEWNVQVSPQADTGLYQASTLLESYERLVEFEVDSADIWGVEFRRLMTGLARPNQTNNTEDENYNFVLTPAGEIIRSLFQTTPGLSSIALEASNVVNNAHELGAENTNYTLTSFGDEDRAVIYLGSRSDQNITLDFDRGQYFNGAHHVVVQTFTAHDDPTTTLDESIPELAQYAQVSTNTFSSEQLNNLSYELKPGEIIRIEYVLGESGITLEGQVSAPVPGLNYDDIFRGSRYEDTLAGNQGDDIIDGGRGNDIIYGGTGEDTLRGDLQSDIIDGGEAADRISGGANTDVLLGGEGNDTLHGGNHSDLLFGGDGSNKLFGGDGNDTLFSTGADDTLDGGNGVDLYSVSPYENTIIEGWSADQVDLISFQGYYNDPNAVRNRIVEVSYDDGRAGDLIIEHDGGARTTLVGAAGQQESVLSSLFDSQPIGESTLQQADLISSLTPNQVTALTSALNTEEYAAYRLTIEPTLLAHNLDGERFAHFLNGLGYPEAYDFLHDIPKDNLSTLTEEMQGPELNMFLSSLSYEAMIAFLRNISSDTFRNISLTFDNETHEHIGEILGRFTSDYDYYQVHSEEGSLSDVTTLLTPNDPIVEELQEEQTEEEEPEIKKPLDPVAAGCFIATAVYADPDHPDVWLLRWFRDEILRSYLLGRAFIVAYWHLGPKMSEIISNNSLLVRVFYSVIRILVVLICVCFKREVGRQPDHRDHSSSRLIKIGWASRQFRTKREFKEC